jgi:hypothetical protein
LGGELEAPSAAGREESVVDGVRVTGTGVIDQVVALVAMEQAIEEAIGRQASLSGGDSELHGALAEIGVRSRAQRRELEGYLRERGAGPTSQSSPIAALLSVAGLDGPLGVLSVDHAAFSFAATEYSVLTELALRLCDTSLREIAPRHLASYARAVRLLSSLLPSVVVAELDRQGVDCRCICPMCSIGACGCTLAGRSLITDAWLGARPDDDGRPGLTLTSPRRDSQLAENGVHSGDRLVEIDGHQLTAVGWEAITEIQAAIRTHAIGEELTVRVATGSAEPREIRVRHVSDYPTE